MFVIKAWQMMIMSGLYFSITSRSLVAMISFDFTTAFAIGLLSSVRR